VTTLSCRLHEGRALADEARRFLSLPREHAAIPQHPPQRPRGRAHPTFSLARLGLSAAQHGIRHLSRFAVLPWRSNEELVCRRFDRAIDGACDIRHA